MTRTWPCPSSSVRVPATSVRSTRIWLQAILSSIPQGRHRWVPFPGVWRPPASKRWPSIYAARPTNTRPRPGSDTHRPNMPSAGPPPTGQSTTANPSCRTSTTPSSTSTRSHPASRPRMRSAPSPGASATDRLPLGTTPTPRRSGLPIANADPRKRVRTDTSEDDAFHTHQPREKR